MKLSSIYTDNVIDRQLVSRTDNGLDEGVASKISRAALMALLGASIGQSIETPRHKHVEPVPMPQVSNKSFKSGMPTRAGAGAGVRLSSRLSNTTADGVLKMEDDPAVYAGLHGWEELSDAARATEAALQQYNDDRISAKEFLVIAKRELSVIWADGGRGDWDLREYSAYRGSVLADLIRDLKFRASDELGRELSHGSRNF